MALSTLHELLNILSNSQRKDLNVFVKMSSNHLSKREEEIIILLLKESSLTNSFSEEHFKETYLNDSEWDNWNRMKNRFLKVIKKYLVMGLQSDQRVNSNLFLATFLNHKGLNKNYQAIANRLNNDFTKQINQMTFHQQFLFYEMEVGRNRDVRKQNEQLQKMKTNLEYHYVENKLRILCEQLNRKIIINKSVDTDSIDSILKESVITDYPIRIQIYFYIFQMLKTEETKYFDSVLELISQNKQRFTEDYTKSILLYLMNFCSMKMNEGEEIFAQTYIEIVKLQIEERIFLENNKISPNRFKNCITIGLIANKLEWAIWFLERYRVCLPKESRVVCSDFNLAQILFSQKKYDKCHQKLIYFQTQDMYHKIAYEKLLLKLYYYQYQSKDFNLKKFRNKIESFRKYIVTQKRLSETKKKRILAFLKYLYKLINKESFSKHELKGNVPLVDYVWFKKESS